MEKNVLDAAALCKLLCGGRLQGIRIFRGIAASSTTFAGPAASLANLVASLASLSLLATAYLASLAIPVTWLHKKGQ